MTPESSRSASQPQGAALAVLLSALAAVTVPPRGLATLRERLVAEARVGGANPPEPLQHFPVAGLGLDSLGRMEFCIQLELDHGVPLTPDRLLAMHELGELLSFIASASPAPPP